MTTRKPGRGRPALGPGRGAQGKSISTRVDLDEAARLDAYCRAHETTVAKLLRRLITPYLKPSGVRPPG